jgi:hypothetical protein
MGDLISHADSPWHGVDPVFCYPITRISTQGVGDVHFNVEVGVGKPTVELNQSLIGFVGVVANHGLQAEFLQASFNF